MRISQIVAQYILHKQSLGMRFRTESVILKSFSRQVGDVEISTISPDLWLFVGSGIADT